MQNLKVLLLDDEVVICEIIRREVLKLKELNASFIETETGTGKEALSLLESTDTPPDLLFIDLRLNNGLTGFDVIDEILKRFEKSKMFIVILTGCWEGSDDWNKALDYMRDGKVDSVLGKWGIGAVLEDIGSILTQIVEKRANGEDQLS